MIPPRPQRRKYLLDPNAHESRSKKKSSSLRPRATSQVHSPPSRITFETAAAAAISRPGTMVVSKLLSPWLSHFTGFANGLFWNFSNSIVSFVGLRVETMEIDLGRKCLESVSRRSTKIKSFSPLCQLSWRHANKLLRYSIEGWGEKCVTTCDFNENGAKRRRENKFRGREVEKKSVAGAPNENGSFLWSQKYFHSRESSSVI